MAHHLMAPASTVHHVGKLHTCVTLPSPSDLSVVLVNPGNDQIRKTICL